MQLFSFFKFLYKTLYFFFYEVSHVIEFVSEGQMNFCHLSIESIHELGKEKLKKSVSCCVWNYQIFLMDWTYFFFFLNKCNTLNKKLKSHLSKQKYIFYFNIQTS